MVVYVETNFLLELAYLQDEHAACERLLADAAAGTITLCMPAFAVAEARVSWRRRAAERTELQHRVLRELRELTRSKPLADLGARSAALVAALVDSGAAARYRLEDAIGSIEGAGRVLPLDTETLRDALDAERRLDLPAPDALIYASVLRHAAAGGGAKCFLNRNTKDFANPDVYSELARHACKVLPGFEQGYAYVASALMRQADE